MDNTRHALINSVTKGILESLVLLVIVLTTVCGVHTGTCPKHVSHLAHGHTVVHNNICYLFVNKELYWPEARDKCRDLSGEMLRIEDSDTMEFIKKTLDSRELSWHRNGVWLGAKVTAGKWMWTNGKGMTYTNWAEKQPETLFGITLKKCLLMRQESDWKWHNKVCDFHPWNYNYICQFPAIKIIDNTSIDPLQTGQEQVNEKSAILTIIVGISVSLLVIIGIILVTFLCYRHNSHKRSSQFRNNLYHIPSTRTTHQDYQTPCVSTNQTPFSSNDALYMTPSEVIESTSDLTATSCPAKSFRCCHVQMGACTCHFSNTSSELEIYSECWPEQEPKLPLMTSSRTANNKQITHLNCCCSDNLGEYIEMNRQGKGRHSKEDNEKHVYNNVNYKQSGRENNYENVQ